MRLIEQNIRPRDICTRKAFENAAAGGGRHRRLDQRRLHLPAMAHECGIRFTLHDVAEIMRPHALSGRPEAGRALRRQGHGRGRRRADAAATLLDAGLLHGDCMTVTGKTLRREPGGRELQRAEQQVIRPVSNPLSPTGGVVGPEGLARPDGAIVKVRRASSHRVHRGPARLLRRRGGLFRGGAEAATTSPATSWSSATKAPRAGRACARCCRPRRPSTARACSHTVALITDGRFSGATRGLCIGHVGPEAQVGRPDRPGPGRRHHHHRRRRRAPSSSRSTRSSWSTARKAAWKPRKTTLQLAARSGSSPSWSGRPIWAPPTHPGAAEKRPTSTRTSSR